MAASFSRFSMEIGSRTLPSRLAQRAGWVELTGVARLDRRTKQLVRRLQPGDIAIVDHADLDRVSAEELVETGVRVVVNVSESLTGRYPNPGPLLLVRGGVRLIDAPGAELFDTVSEGEVLTVRGSGVYRNGTCLALGRSRDEAELTLAHMREERELLSGKIELPRFDTDFRDRPVVVVVRGVDHQSDLQALKPYIRDVRPVLVGVDGGANAIIEAGFKPDMIVGDMDSAQEATLRSGAELVVHAYHDGRAPGREHLEELGLPHKIVPAPGTSQDVAMLIAAEKGAELIVSVGSQSNLVEFLDKARKGMSSTFLTRLRLGEILVDAKGVSRLYRPRPGLAPVALVAAAGLVTLVATIALTPGLREVVDLLWLKLQVLLGGDV